MLAADSLPLPLDGELDGTGRGDVKLDVIFQVFPLLSVTVRRNGCDAPGGSGPCPEAGNCVMDWLSEGLCEVSSSRFGDTEELPRRNCPQSRNRAHGARWRLGSFLGGPSWCER